MSGLTLNELNKLLDKSYKKYIKYPMVQTEVVSYRPVKILLMRRLIILDIYSWKALWKKMQFLKILIMNYQDKLFLKTIYLSKLIQNKTGKNKFSHGATLFDAIRRSGGITTFSNLRDIEVIRKNSISEVEVIRKLL